MPLILQPYQVTKKRKKEDLCYFGQSPPVSTLASSLGCTFSSDWHTASPTLPIPKRPGLSSSPSSSESKGGSPADNYHSHLLIWVEIQYPNIASQVRICMKCPRFSWIAKSLLAPVSNNVEPTAVTFWVTIATTGCSYNGGSSILKVINTRTSYIIVWTMMIMMISSVTGIAS